MHRTFIGKIIFICKYLEKLQCLHINFLTLEMSKEGVGKE